MSGAQLRKGVAMAALGGSLGRRGLLTGGLGLTAAALAPGPAMAALKTGSGERALAFHHTHTGETLRTVFWADGGFVAEGLRDLDRLLRDFRTGDVHAIDPELFNLLHRAQTLTGGAGKRFEIISGFRSHKTNEMLRGASTGVAKKSLHQQGKAIDVRLPGVDLGHLRKAALALKGGGVGYYPEPQFVHMDTGRVRFW
ncbi:MAG: DUF882 domain-containing protein [Alphaproteobacteria bacterium]|nr:DUF882 domain-containing protein [Alphaproteobacteria bacterium]